jgi:hypothetical protein
MGQSPIFQPILQVMIDYELESLSRTRSSQTALAVRGHPAPKTELFIFWKLPAPNQRRTKMKRNLLALTVLVLAASAGSADQKPKAGTIISEISVDCGTKKQGKKESTALLCQQYVVRTATSEYQVRQPKPSNQAIIPANTPIEFTLDKDKMKFKVNGKKYEFLVVGNSAIGAQTK